MSITALDEALYVWTRRENLDRQARFDAATSLGEWGLFSLRQIAAIVGLSHTTVARLTGGREARTGGKFDPACLTALRDISLRRRRGEAVEQGEVKAMLDAGSGTSAGFAARLGGISESWLRREARK